MLPMNNDELMTNDDQQILRIHDIAREVEMIL